MLLVAVVLDGRGYEVSCRKIRNFLQYERYQILNWHLQTLHDSRCFDVGEAVLKIAEVDYTAQVTLPGRQTRQPAALTVPVVHILRKPDGALDWSLMPRRVMPQGAA